MSFSMFTRLTTPKHLLFVTNNSTIHDSVELSGASYPIYDPYETITRVPLLMATAIYLTSSGMWLSWRICTSGSLDMIPSRVLCSWGCVSGD